jgi:hypothetical protein
MLSTRNPAGESLGLVYSCMVVSELLTSGTLTSRKRAGVLAVMYIWLRSGDVGDEKFKDACGRSWRWESMGVEVGRVMQGTGRALDVLTLQRSSIISAAAGWASVRLYVKPDNESVYSA